ncbi:MAG: nuclear transport factor 2 family protein [Ferruginibacter sp.]
MHKSLLSYRNYGLLAFACTFLLMLGGYAQRSVKDPVILTIEKHMQDWRLALLSRDSATLVSLLSDDLTYGHTNALMQTKQSLIASVMQGEQVYKKIDFVSMNTRLYENTALVNVLSNVSLIYLGKEMTLGMEALFVWCKQNGIWKLVARQSVKNS